MTTTLIVRDATLAINGVPEQRGNPADYLRDRIAEVAGFERSLLEECAEVFRNTVSAETEDVELLEAATVLGLAKPQLSMGVEPIVLGRALAARWEEQGQVEGAKRLLEILMERHPAHKTLERDLSLLMRRQGMISELADRYETRAKLLLAEGKVPEAVAWLREVLLLDKSRKDVARTIRDLRYQEMDRVRGQIALRRTVAVTLIISLLLSLAFLRERRLHAEYQTLPPAVNGDLASIKARLSSVESFIARHPIWHRSLDVVRERADLRVQVEDIEKARRQAIAAAAERDRLRREEAELARQRGRRSAELGDFVGAIAEFERALELAEKDWEPRARVERDLQAIREYVAAGSEPAKENP